MPHPDTTTQESRLLTISLTLAVWYVGDAPLAPGHALGHDPALSCGELLTGGAGKGDPGAENGLPASADRAPARRQPRTVWDGRGPESQR